MASDFEIVCDAIAADLTTSVPAISAPNVPILHKYAPWDPEELEANPGERHMAVWPSPVETEVATPFVTDGGDLLVQRYVVMYWEHVGAEASDGVIDEDAAATFLQLHNDIRARFYVRANMRLGSPTVPVTDVRYSGSSIGERPRAVRWFADVLRVTRTIDVT